MAINVTEATTEETVPLDQFEHLVIISDQGLRQVAQQLHHRRPSMEMAKGYLTNHKRMAADILVINQAKQSPLGHTQVSYPHRAIHKDHDSALV